MTGPRWSLADAFAALFVPLACVILACTPQTPQPSPSPSPTVAPTPTCVVPPDGPAWQPVDPVPPSELFRAVRNAQEAVGDVCGQEPEASLDVLASALRAAGVCAARQADAVMVEREDGLWEEHHAAYYGNGCWLSNTYRGAWMVTR